MNTPDTMAPLARTDSPTHTLAKVALERLGPFSPTTPGFIGGSKNLVVAVTSTVLGVVDRALTTTKDPDFPATPHVVAVAVTLTAVTTPEACTTGPCGWTKTVTAESTPDTMVPLARIDSPTHTLAKVASGRLGTKNLVVAVTSIVLGVVDRALATTKDPDVPATPHAVAFAVT